MSRSRFAAMARSIGAGLGLIVMLLPAPALAGSALPRGFVYLRDVDPTIVQDIRYAGSHITPSRPPSVRAPEQ
jgi:D-alanyl-D-alanine dipeptidase